MRLVICCIAAILTALGCSSAYFNWHSADTKSARYDVAYVNEKLKTAALPNVIPDPSPTAGFDPFRDAGAKSVQPFDPAALGLVPANPVPPVLTPERMLRKLYPNESRSWKAVQEQAAVSLTPVVFQAAGLGILGGIAGWFGAWLLIVSIAFCWWFILDRIREFARAVKGQP